MVHPWQWLLITNLKVLVEEEGEITIREVMEDMEVEEISLLALVVTILIQIEVSIAICLNLIRVASPDLQGFKVKLNDHNIRFLEIMDIVANSSQVHVANGWLTDTGCLDHVTPNLANISLQQQRTLGSRTMTVVNGKKLPVTHIGNGELCTTSHNFRLDGILRDHDLASNLLSVHKLCLQNNSLCYFDAYRFSIQDLSTRKILYKGLSKDGVYLIPASYSLDSSIFLSISSNYISFCFHFCQVCLDFIVA